MSLIDPMSGTIANPSARSVPHSLQESSLACWPSQNLARRLSLIGQHSALPTLLHLFPRIRFDISHLSRKHLSGTARCPDHRGTHVSNSLDVSCIGGVRNLRRNFPIVPGGRTYDSQRLSLAAPIALAT